MNKSALALGGYMPMLIEDRRQKELYFRREVAEHFDHDTQYFCKISDTCPKELAVEVASKIRDESYVLFLDSTWTQKGERAYMEGRHDACDCVIFLQTLSALLLVDTNIVVVLYTTRIFPMEIFPQNVTPVASSVEKADLIEPF